MLVNHENLIELFKHIVKQHSNEPALKDCNKTFSYQEVYDKARVIALIIRQKTAPGQNIVCISKKDVESIICFWGILLGGAVPIMLDEDDGLRTNETKTLAVSPALIIADKTKIGSSDVLNTEATIDFVTLFDQDNCTLDQSLTDNVVIPELCYILLTSGTTGIPKAVEITHKNVVHYTSAIYSRIGNPKKVVAGHVTTFSADLGLTNLLVALISGGMLRIFNKEESTDPALFNSILRDDKVSLLKMTPSHLLSILEGLDEHSEIKVDTIILGGEKLSWALVQKLFDLKLCHNIYNHYGPTETTIGAMAYKVEQTSPHFNKTLSVPIGSALGNTITFLDNRNGDTGELLIGGAGVSKGYIANDLENKKRFVCMKVAGISETYFKTGDLCRQLTDGNIEFLYRVDRQVKVRGYRIELGELEVVLNSHPNIVNAIAALSDQSDQPVLEAYVKLADGIEMTQGALRKWLESRLPGYKIPTFIHFFDKTPFNANGKIDLGALKQTINRAQVVEKVAEVKEQASSWPVDLAATWKSVLNVSLIEYTDNFFESGGDSLHAIQMIGRLQRHGYKINISHLNRNPVFAELIAINPDKQTSNSREIALQHVNNRTYTQNAFLAQEKYDRDQYLQSILLETDHRIAIREVTLALDYLLKNHAELVTPVINKLTHTESAHGMHSPDIGVTILRKTEPIVTQIQQQVASIQDCISIERGKLIKVHVFVDPDGKDYIFLVCHHWVVDVISWNIIIDEFLEYYECLIDKRIPIVVTENLVDSFYNKLSANPKLKANLQPIVKGPVFRLPLKPLKHQRPEVQKVFHFVIPSEISDILRQMEEQEDPYMLSSFMLNSFYLAILSEFSLEKLSVDVEFHGRPQLPELPDLSRSVAWWATTVQLDISVEDIDPRQFCSQLKAKSEHASNLNLLNDQHMDAHHECSDVRFNYLGHFPEKFSNSSISLVPSFFNPGPTRNKDAQKEYLIFFTSRFIGSVLSVDIQYQADKIGMSSLNRMINSFFINLKKAINRKSLDHLKLQRIEGNMQSVGQPLHNICLSGKQNSTERRNVFLTGVTGFLGIHILADLLKDGETDVYCLVRKDEQQNAESRLINHFQYYFDELPAHWKNVKIITGDLRRKNFGVREDEYKTLTEHIDVIIHAAADVNLLKDYFELKETNIQPVKNLISFARTEKSKAIHYISTLAVSGFSSGQIIKDFSENDFNYGQGFISDYEKTKFDAEELIRQFLSNGGEGKIYRSGHIAADSVDGKFQRNLHQNRVFQIINGMLLLRQIPQNYYEKLSFTYVDVVASVIVNFALQKIESPLQCLHIENPESISFKKVAQMLSQMGYVIESVEMSVFNTAVEQFDGTQDEKEIIHLMSNWIRRHIDFPRSVNYQFAQSIDTMARAGIYFPAFTKNWFSKMISDGIDKKYFLPPVKAEEVYSL